MTALISVNGAVAALVPMVVILAVQLGRPPSQMLMPLAFAAHAGSMLALTGTPVNVLVSEAAHDAGVGRFGFFSYTLLGVPLLIGTIAIVVLFGNQLLPSRYRQEHPGGPQLARTHAARSVPQRPLGVPSARRLRPRRSSVAPATTSTCPLTRRWSVVGVQHGGDGIPSRNTPIVADDMLIVRGTVGVVEQLCAAEGVEFVTAPQLVDEREELFSREQGLAELVVPPRSAFVGEIVFPGMVTDSGDLRDPGGPTQGHRPRSEGSEARRRRHAAWCKASGPHSTPTSTPTPTCSLSTRPSLVRRQAVPLGLGAKRAIAILTVMVVLLATGAGAVGGGQPAGSDGDGAVPCAHARAGLPRCVVDRRHPGGRHDPDVHRHSSRPARPTRSPTPWCRWWATPAPTRCSPASSC